MCILEAASAMEAGSQKSGNFQSLGPAKLSKFSDKTQKEQTFKADIYGALIV